MTGSMSSMIFLDLLFGDCPSETSVAGAGGSFLLSFFPKEIEILALRILLL